jgi:probable rRNA maturation factor
MAAYNERFLDRTGPTDVLAFPVEELLPGVVPDHDPQGPPLMLGDVVVAPAYVRRQAQEYGVSYEDEMALMVIHGILHLLGYDHIDEDEAERMEERERRLLANVGRTRR